MARRAKTVVRPPAGIIIIKKTVHLFFPYGTMHLDVRLRVQH
jgi:hypothetical protein